MFNSKNNSMAKSVQSDSASINLIGAGTIIDGDIKSNGDIRIDGTLTGSLNVKGKLVVGPTGNIDGEITCQNADVSGSIKGKINVTELLSLKATSKLSGDIITNKLSIEPGADFSGSCSMGGVVKEIHNAERKDSPVKEKAAAY